MAKVPDEAVKESYMLRATFFYNRLRSEGYFDLFAQLTNYSLLEGGKLDWTRRKAWKIDEEAWDMLNNASMAPELVFVHPKVLQLNPSFLKYYRSVALIPQKGLKNLAKCNIVDKIEIGKVESGKIPLDALKNLVCSINEIASLVVKLSSSLNAKEIEGMMYATAGTKIDGSWRNSIGDEGERVIRTILFKELYKNKEISTIKDKNKVLTEVGGDNYDAIKENMANVREMNLINGYSILFSSEPDITFYNPSGEIVGIVEIKAGIDPAGALERLGAMEKSFTNTLDEYPNAVTVLVASCITEEMEKRLGESMLVRQKYVTANITSSDSEQRKFANHMRKILGLTRNQK